MKCITYFTIDNTTTIANINTDKETVASITIAPLSSAIKFFNFCSILSTSFKSNILILQQI
ncbi:hypothetical protein ACTQ2N_04970 [Ruminococcus sp. LCP21S3_E8]